MVYVDHNMGTIVKDAFVIDRPIDDVIEIYNDKVADPEGTFADTDPARARAAVEEAIDHGAMLFPPVETDTWPMCRPLVEWLVRRLPPGGDLPDRHDWTEKALHELRDDFFASEYGKPVDALDERSLLEDITWFGSGWAGADPLRWSPVNVEILMVDWIPRKIVADVEHLAKALNLIRAFIRYCHNRREIPDPLTEETVAAVSQWEPEYQRAIRSSRPQGANALAGALLEALHPAGGESVNIADIMLESLDRAVGGRTVLANLDTEPLPDEDMVWAGLPDDIQPRVREVLDLTDACAAALFDVEHRTAFRRFLSRAAAGDPTIFRRKGAANRAAAAVCWVVASANNSVGPRSSLESQELMRWFGVSGSVSQRAEVFVRAIGIANRMYGGMDLESPDFLVSARCAEIISLRDRYLSMSELADG